MNIPRRAGYTLVEILVAVAVISILTTVVLASVGGARSKTRDAKRLSEIKQLKGAIENFFSACYQYPAALSDLNGAESCPTYVPDLLLTLPQDPDLPYGYYADAPSTGKRFHLCAQMENIVDPDKGKAASAPFDVGDPCDGGNKNTFDVTGGAL